jgi:hypothetical protein
VEGRKWLSKGVVVTRVLVLCLGNVCSRCAPVQGGDLASPTVQKFAIGKASLVSIAIFATRAEPELSESRGFP